MQSRAAQPCANACWTWAWFPVRRSAWRRVAPLGDPVEYMVKGYRLSLRRSEAAHVLVERLPCADRPEAADGVCDPADAGPLPAGPGCAGFTAVLVASKADIGPVVALAGNPNAWQKYDLQRIDRGPDTLAIGPEDGGRRVGGVVRWTAAR